MRRFARIRACRTCQCVISTCIRLLPGLRIISIRRRLTVLSRNQAETFPCSVDPVLRHVRRPADWVRRSLSAVRPLDPLEWVSMGVCLPQRGGSLRARSRLRRRIVCCAVRTSHSGEMAADWPLQGTIDSYLELCIFPLLGCQDPYAHIACGCLHRHTALQRLSAPDGRQDRPQCNDHGPAPVCADLLTIGDNTIVRTDTSILGYRAQSNFIHMGPVTIGSNSFVGEGSVLDIDTAMGNNTQLVMPRRCRVASVCRMASTTMARQQSRRPLTIAQ